MGKPHHIALGESAEACLSAACRAHGMPGTALGIPDDLSHGPLDDGRARIDYMESRAELMKDVFLRKLMDEAVVTMDFVPPVRASSGTVAPDARIELRE